MYTCAPHALLYVHGKPFERDPGFQLKLLLERWEGETACDEDIVVLLSYLYKLRLAHGHHRAPESCCR